MKKSFFLIFTCFTQLISFKNNKKFLYKITHKKMKKIKSFNLYYTYFFKEISLKNGKWKYKKNI